MSDDTIGRLRGMVGAVPSAEQLAEQRRARTAASIKRNRERGMAFNRATGQMETIAPTKGKP
jgi:hypothetical protein